MSLYQNQTYEEQHSPYQELQNHSQDTAVTLEPTAIEDYLVAHILDVLCHLINSSQDADNLTHTDTSISAKSIDENHYFQLLLIGEITSIQTLAIALQPSIGLNDTLLGRQISITTLGIQEFTQANFVQRYDLGCFIHPYLSFSFSKPKLNILSLDVTEPDTTELNKAKFNNPKLLGRESVNPSLQAGEQPNVVTDANTTMAALLTESHLKLIAMRLRDLFAHQSLLFMPVVTDIPAESAFATVNQDPSLSTAKPALAKLPKKAPSTHISNVCFNNLGYTLTATEAEAEAIKPPVVCWQFNLYDYKPQPAWLNSRYWANPDNFDKFRW